MRTFALLAALLCAGAALNGQTSQARITGRVPDPGGAVIPNVEVIATNEATGVPTRANSNEVGVYVLPFLQPATYTISATLTGFKKYERKGVVLDTAAVVELDLTLEVGSVTDVIEVTRSSAITRSIWTFTTAGSTKDRTRSMSSTASVGFGLRVAGQVFRKLVFPNHRRMADRFDRKYAKRRSLYRNHADEQHQ